MCTFATSDEEIIRKRQKYVYIALRAISDYHEDRHYATAIS